MRFKVGDIVRATGFSCKNKFYVGVVLWSNETEVGLTFLKQRRMEVWVVSRNQIVGLYHKSLKAIGKDEGWVIV